VVRPVFSQERSFSFSRTALGAKYQSEEINSSIGGRFSRSSEEYQELKSGNERMKVLNREKNPSEVIKIFFELRRKGIRPNLSTYINAVQACAALKNNKFATDLNRRIVTEGFENARLTTSLISMNARTGNVEKAKQFFDESKEKNVFIWNSIISAYSMNNQSQEATNLYQQMQQSGVQPNTATYKILLASCGRAKDLETGKQIIDSIDEETRSTLQHQIIAMYSTAGEFKKAKDLFGKLETKDAPAYLALIKGYVKNDKRDEAQKLIDQMTKNGLEVPPIVERLMSNIDVAQEDA